MSIEDEKHKDIDQIKNEVDAEFEDKKYEEFQKDWNPKKINQKTALTDIKNIICAYTYITREKFNYNFSIRRTQIYSILQSYEMFIDKFENSQKNKGVVYQINTGEGKSCIISLISAILSKSGKNVHVVSSNIKLSNRDYLESYDFFQSLNVVSTVLLSKSELPYNAKNSSLNVENEYLKAKNEGKYPDKFFKDEVFANPSRMNFITCGLDNNNSFRMAKKKRIIFSSLVNFECFYLQLVENRPGCIDEYFNECVLLIDEADSILIDEITNGTIISREMKSNANEVLSKVFNSYHNEKSIDQVLNELKQKPLCKEITKEDVEQMYKEIQIVESPEFSEGKKYSVEEFSVKNKKRIKHMIKRTVNFIDNTKKEIKNELKSLFLGYEEEEEDFDEEEEDLSIEKTRKFKTIIPFDYDHKGILEPNKEFCGFIPQFIALKEKKQHPDLIFKDISISYLYISHPIFANLYKCICGFTGTIGKDDDKLIFLNQYKLTSQKIYRHKPNLRVDFPITFCDDINERNKKISDEVLYFHEKGNPVLVIFQDFKEIIEVAKLIQNEYCEQYNKNNQQAIHKTKENDDIKYANYQRMISNKTKKLFIIEPEPNTIKTKAAEQRMNTIYNSFHDNIKNVNIEIYIFDGKDEFIKPDLIAGFKGAVSLGSNICGRGTDIKCLPEYPLHVIVSFYSPNDRVMQQAFGRTARKGQVGSCHVICLKEQIYQKRNQNSEFISKIVKEIEYKTIKQREFVNEFKSRLPWLFGSVEEEKFSNIKNYDDIKILRKTRINVNRIVAYKYRFPICISYESFIKIQAQKILSLFNCPNSVFTWRLVQRYIRELILESWTLMEKKVEQKYEENRTLNFNQLLDSEIDKLNELLKVYLPPEINGIVPLFINICKIVIQQYEDKILNDKKSHGMFTIKIFKSTYINFGFKPYSLLSESGARILYTNLSKMNYISDPELKYQRKGPDNKKISKVSITERIDDALNKLFQMINKILGQKTFLKFFVRRTVAGCEFGACFDLLILNEKSDIKDNAFILIDKNPIIVFTIFAWSMVPLLIGILIILVIYLIKISKKIAKYIACPALLVKDVVAKAKDKAKDFLTDLSKKINPDFYNVVSEKINQYLEYVLKEQLKKIKQYDKDSIFIKLADLLNFSDKKDYLSKISDKLNKSIGSISISPSLNGILKGFKISPNILKTGLLLILCISTFLANFKHSKSIEFKNKIEQHSKELDSAFNSDSPDKEDQIQNKIDDYEKEIKSEIEIDDDQSEIKETNFEKIMKMTQESEYYKFMKERNNQPSPYEIDLSDVLISDDDKYHALYMPSKKVCLKIHHKPDKQFFDLLSSEKITMPVILKPLTEPFLGFVISGDDLSFFLFDVIELTKNLYFDSNGFIIFAYGLAVGMEYLHQKNVIYNLSPNDVFLFNDYYPFILEREPIKSGSNIDLRKKESVYSYGKILSDCVEKNKNELNHSIFSINSFSNSMIKNCKMKLMNFSQICNEIEREFMKNIYNDRVKKYIQGLKEYRNSYKKLK